MKVKNQHYVPRTYLKAFAKNDRHLWAYGKAEKKSFNANINDIASGKYFYDHEAIDSMQGGRWIEKQFGKLESHYPKMLARLNAAGWEIDAELLFPLQ